MPSSKRSGGRRRDRRAAVVTDAERIDRIVQLGERLALALKEQHSRSWTQVDIAAVTRDAHEQNQLLAHLITQPGARSSERMIHAIMKPALLAMQDGRDCLPDMGALKSNASERDRLGYLDFIARHQATRSPLWVVRHYSMHSVQRIVEEAAEHAEMKNLVRRSISGPHYAIIAELCRSARAQDREFATNILWRLYTLRSSSRTIILESLGQTMYIVSNVSGHAALPVGVPGMLELVTRAMQGVSTPMRPLHRVRFHRYILPLLKLTHLDQAMKELLPCFETYVRSEPELGLDIIRAIGKWFPLVGGKKTGIFASLLIETVLLLRHLRGDQYMLGDVWLPLVRSLARGVAADRSMTVSTCILILDNTELERYLLPTRASPAVERELRGPLVRGLQFAATAHWSVPCRALAQYGLRTHVAQAYQVDYPRTLRGITDLSRSITAVLDQRQGAQSKAMDALEVACRHTASPPPATGRDVTSATLERATSRRHDEGEWTDMRAWAAMRAPYAPPLGDSGVLMRALDEAGSSDAMRTAILTAPEQVLRRALTPHRLVGGEVIAEYLAESSEASIETRIALAINAANDISKSPHFHERIDLEKRDLMTPREAHRLKEAYSATLRFTVCGPLATAIRVSPSDAVINASVGSEEEAMAHREQGDDGDQLPAHARPRRYFTIGDAMAPAYEALRRARRRQQREQRACAERDASSQMHPSRRSVHDGESGASAEEETCEGGDMEAVSGAQTSVSERNGVPVSPAFKTAATRAPEQQPQSTQEKAPSGHGRQRPGRLDMTAMSSEQGLTLQSPQPSASAHVACEDGPDCTESFASAGLQTSGSFSEILARSPSHAPRRQSASGTNRFPAFDAAVEAAQADEPDIVAEPELQVVESSTPPETGAPDLPALALPSSAASDENGSEGAQPSDEQNPVVKRAQVELQTENGDVGFEDVPLTPDGSRTSSQTSSRSSSRQSVRIDAQQAPPQGDTTQRKPETLSAVAQSPAGAIPAPSVDAPDQAPQRAWLARRGAPAPTESEDADAPDGEEIPVVQAPPLGFMDTMDGEMSEANLEGAPTPTEDGNSAEHDRGGVTTRPWTGDARVLDPDAASEAGSVVGSSVVLERDEGDGGSCVSASGSFVGNAEGSDGGDSANWGVQSDAKTTEGGGSGGGAISGLEGVAREFPRVDGAGASAGWDVCDEDGVPAAPESDQAMPSRRRRAQSDVSGMGEIMARQSTGRRHTEHLAHSPGGGKTPQSGLAGLDPLTNPNARPRGQSIESRGSRTVNALRELTVAARRPRELSAGSTGSDNSTPSSQASASTSSASVSASHRLITHLLGNPPPSQKPSDTTSAVQHARSVESTTQAFAPDSSASVQAMTPRRTPAQPSRGLDPLVTSPTPGQPVTQRSASGTHARAVAQVTGTLRRQSSAEPNPHQKDAAQRGKERASSQHKSTWRVESTRLPTAIVHGPGTAEPSRRFTPMAGATTGRGMPPGRRTSTDSSSKSACLPAVAQGSGRRLSGSGSAASLGRASRPGSRGSGRRTSQGESQPRSRPVSLVGSQLGSQHGSQPGSQPGSLVSSVSAATSASAESGPARQRRLPASPRSPSPAEPTAHRLVASGSSGNFHASVTGLDPTRRASGPVPALSRGGRSVPSTPTDRQSRADNGAQRWRTPGSGQMAEPGRTAPRLQPLGSQGGRRGDADAKGSASALGSGYAEGSWTGSGAPTMGGSGTQIGSLLDQAVSPSAGSASGTLLDQSQLGSFSTMPGGSVSSGPTSRPGSTTGPIQEPLRKGLTAGARTPHAAQRISVGDALGTERAREGGEAGTGGDWVARMPTVDEADDTRTSGRTESRTSSTQSSRGRVYRDHDEDAE